MRLFFQRVGVILLFLSVVKSAVADLTQVGGGTVFTTGSNSPPAMSATDQLEGTTPTTAYTLASDSNALSTLTDGTTFDAGRGVKLAGGPTNPPPQLLVFDLAASGKPLGKAVEWSFAFQGAPNTVYRISAIYFSVDGQTWETNNLGRMVRTTPSDPTNYPDYVDYGFYKVNATSIFNEAPRYFSFAVGQGSS